MEVVSYGSENDGVPFVNLVTLPGAGAMAEKSKGGMRGHTDAATFPFRGTFDPENKRIAPSPDIVFLAACRNPDRVPTVVMPLEDVLGKLSADQLAALKGPNIVLNAQRSFQRGTKQILGDEHLLDGAAILLDCNEGTWVRYTHSQSHLYDEADKAAGAAKEAFEHACASSAQHLALEPGDLLLVNNRRALHGRAAVGDSIGGRGRWLVRSYGLDCTTLRGEQRYESAPYKLFP
ncbi:TauD/TfdA family dioxygenase [Ramlibacter tataouinensis]|uniref:TauD/TfdA family dioxygenase n=1 Tax=Ramlibacter tataouinensis TaxID=94132 RepID=UPI0022F3B950|nr:TauD/TfdA family dioxygenase [Ramlibacter tataouinensis]WBY00048.1 TauD/TfdA family dioxygenase [Ramlibacter tataouinensis]